MKNTDILYNVIIYRERKKVEIYNKDNVLIYQDDYLNENDMYKGIVIALKNCKDVNQINIINK